MRMIFNMSLDDLVEGAGREGISALDLNNDICWIKNVDKYEASRIIQRKLNKGDWIIGKGLRIYINKNAPSINLHY